MAWEDLLVGLVNSTGIGGATQIANDQARAQTGLTRAQTGLMQAQIGAQQQKQQQAQQYQMRVQEYLRNPTPQALSNLAIEFPEAANELETAYKLMDVPQRRADLGFWGGVRSAAVNKKPQLVITALRQRRDAMQQAGADTTEIEGILGAAQDGDLNPAIGWAQANIAAADPDKWADTYGAATKDSDGYTLSPGQRRYDREGNVIAEAPFAPRPITVGEGQTVVEYQPGGGGPTSSGDTIGRMLQITPFSESGNREYNADGSRVTSPKGARGIMQVMPHTAKNPGYGIAPSNGTPEDDARLGRQYLAKMLEIYGNPEQAWAAYNAGPGAVDRAIRDGGGQWLSKMPAETRQYVNKNMSALNRGGQGGGSRVIAQGAPKQDNAPSGYRYSANGNLEAIPGGPADTNSQASKKDVRLTEAENKGTGLLAQAVAATSALNTIEGYRPSEIANALNDLSTKNPVKRNLSQVDRRALNAQLAFSTAILRLESGAVITPEEAAQKALTLFPSPGDGPDVQVDKRRQRDAALASLRAAAGRGSGGVKAALPPGSGAQANAPKRVRSIQEARALPPGTVFITPDGRRKVR